MTRSDIEFAEGKSNTRKEWIDNMIADSKKRKAERQRYTNTFCHRFEKKFNVNLTHRLGYIGNPNKSRRQFLLLSSDIKSFKVVKINV